MRDIISPPHIFGALFFSNFHENILFDIDNFNEIKQLTEFNFQNVIKSFYTFSCKKIFSLTLIMVICLLQVKIVY